MKLPAAGDLPLDKEYMKDEFKTDGGLHGDPPLAPSSSLRVSRISKFLRIVLDPSMPDERGVMSNDGKIIAVLGYYKPWREWVLYPEPRTVWSHECLEAIKREIQRLMLC